MPPAAVGGPPQEPTTTILNVQFLRLKVQISAACNVGLEFTTCSLMLVPLKPKYPTAVMKITGGSGRTVLLKIQALRGP